MRAAYLGRAVCRLGLSGALAARRARRSAAVRRLRQEIDQTLTIAVDAPFSRSPYIGRDDRARRRARGRARCNGGGVSTAGGELHAEGEALRQRALAAQGAREHAHARSPTARVAIVDDGTGVDASLGDREQGAASRSGSRTTAAVGLVDLEQRPNVFRIAPTDRGIAFRLAEYTIPKGLKLALLHDDTTTASRARRRSTRRSRAIRRPSRRS